MLAVPTMLATCIGSAIHATHGRRLRTMEGLVTPGVPHKVLT